MAQLPPNVIDSPLHHALIEGGYERIHQGKVRDTHSVRSGKRMQVARDGISVFDFVLPAEVPDKGPILTAQTIFWLSDVLKDVPNHLHAFGRNRLGSFVSTEVLDKHELWKRAVVIEPLRMLPYELIVRGYLTGTGWKSYQKTGKVCGHELPPGLFDGAKLPAPIFTPTTKATEGHDVHVDAGTIKPALADLALAIYTHAAQWARKRRVIIADTKFEFGFDPAHGDETDDVAILADEVLTPDSSRFWDEGEWNEATKVQKTPPAYDKEVVRQWAKTVPTPWGRGIHELDPVNDEHVAFVHGLEVPRDVLMEASHRYHVIFERLVGSTLVDFQNAAMR